MLMREFSLGDFNVNRRHLPMLLIALAVSASSLLAQTPPLTPDIPAKFEKPTAGYDYTKREVMIPMRDGVKLYTVITIPNGAKNAPILLTRTPYDAEHRAERSDSFLMLNELPQGDEVFVKDGYIRVFQEQGYFQLLGAPIERLAATSACLRRPLRGRISERAGNDPQRPWSNFSARRMMSRSVDIVFARPTTSCNSSSN